MSQSQKSSCERVDFILAYMPCSQLTAAKQPPPQTTAPPACVAVVCWEEVVVLVVTYNFNLASPRSAVPRRRSAPLPGLAVRLNWRVAGCQHRSEGDRKRPLLLPPPPVPPAVVASLSFLLEEAHSPRRSSPLPLTRLPPLTECSIKGPTCGQRHV